MIASLAFASLVVLDLLRIAPRLQRRLARHVARDAQRRIDREWLDRASTSSVRWGDGE